MKYPYFSIITPMYNRRNSISRTIESCLFQSFDNFEMIVVDDASTDASREVVETYNDSRLRLLCHSINRGPCPTRNTGIYEAQGQWYIMLDSDKSLLPGALERLYYLTQQVPKIGNIATRCLWDRPWDGGDITPLPWIAPGELDYVGYLKWINTLNVSEYLNCIRADVFSSLTYPNSRAWELSFHLDMVKKWRFQITQDVLVLVHTDAPNRLTTERGPAASRRMLMEAKDKLENIYEIWHRHDALRVYAPKRYNLLLREAARLSFLCGDRFNGLSYILQYLRRDPSHIRAWMMPIFGLLGPKVTAWANSL